MQTLHDTPQTPDYWRKVCMFGIDVVVGKKKKKKKVKKEKTRKKRKRKKLTKR